MTRLLWAVCRAVKRASNGALHLTTLPKSGEQHTMSSLEIAERTGKNHADVMRDIRSTLKALHLLHEGEVASSFAGYYVASNGKRNPCFNLPKRECMILISGYSVELRAAIIDRWQELEQAKPALPDFSDEVAAARAWADEAGCSERPRVPLSCA